MQQIRRSAHSVMHRKLQQKNPTEQIGACAFEREKPLTYELEVFGINGVYLGKASSFGTAKRMQQASLPDDLKIAYAGYHNGVPIFYTEMLTPELLDKYPRLASRLG